MLRASLDVRRSLRGVGAASLWIAMALADGLAGQEKEPKPAPKDNPAAKPKEAAKKPAAAKAKPKSGPGLDWLGLEPGLAQVRTRRLPGLILLDVPGEPAGDPPPPVGEAPPRPHFLQDVLTDSSLKDTLKRFVLIRIQPADLEKPYPAATPAKAGKGEKAGAKGKAAEPKAPEPKAAEPDAGEAPGADVLTVSGKLGLGGQQSALVAISYWEDPQLTYKEGNPPTKSRAREELTRFWKVNGVYAEVARRVEADVEKSKYAAANGNQREATIKIRDHEPAKAQTHMDPVLKKRVNELIQDYRAKAQKAIEDGNKLDQAKKWPEAINAFDKVMTDFPFQDIQQQANKRKGECLRKMTVGF